MNPINLSNIIPDRDFKTSSIFASLAATTLLKTEIQLEKEKNRILQQTLEKEKMKSKILRDQITLVLSKSGKVGLSKIPKKHVKSRQGNRFKTSSKDKLNGKC